MPKQTRLNKRQIKFVELIVSGERQTKAAVLAGFSEASSKRQAYDLMRNPLVIEEIKNQKKLQEEAIRNAFLCDAYKSQRLLSKIVDKDESADRDRIKAAEGILDRAGFRAVDTPQIKTTTNNVFEGITTDQLLALIGTTPNNDDTDSDE